MRRVRQCGRGKDFIPVQAEIVRPRADDFSATSSRLARLVGSARRAKLADATASQLFALFSLVRRLRNVVTRRSIGSREKPGRRAREVLARHGMVCTSVPAATQVGLDILKRGGSAVDAAIAANATLGLMEPVSNGIGGDLFAIVYSAKDHKLYGLNGSGRSPRGLSYEQMKSELAKLHRGVYAADRDAADQRSRCGRCLGGAAPEIRQAVVRRRSLRRDSLRGGRFSGHAN